MQTNNNHTFTSLRSLEKATTTENGASMKDASFIMADVPLDLREVKKILPFGLKLANPAMATLFYVNYPIFPMGQPYHETIMMVHVKTPFGRGYHCCWILVDQDVALIGGQLMLGYPKKLGKFTWKEDDKGISASVSRRGVKLMSVKALRETREVNPGPIFGVKHFNLGGPGQMVAFNPVWLFKVKENIHESYTATAELVLGDYSPFDPIAKLIDGDPVNARIARMDIIGINYLLPVGFTGGYRWCLNTFNMRIR